MGWHSLRERHFLKKIILAGAATLGLTLSTASSWAGNGQLTNIRICNNFPHPIHFVIAYQQVTGDWMTRGWLAVEPSTCALFDSVLRLPEFYYRAQSDSYRQNGHLIEENWSEGGAQSFCVDKNTNNTFNFWNADKQERCGDNLNQFQQFQSFSNNNSYSSDVDVRTH